MYQIDLVIERAIVVPQRMRKEFNIWQLTQLCTIPNFDLQTLGIFLIRSMLLMACEQLVVTEAHEYLSGSSLVVERHKQTGCQSLLEGHSLVPWPVNASGADGWGDAH